eukprot:2180567-Amphidinium_carterae.1
MATVPLISDLEGNAYRQWVMAMSDNGDAFARTFGPKHLARVETGVRTRGGWLVVMCTWQSRQAVQLPSSCCY